MDPSMSVCRNCASVVWRHICARIAAAAILNSDYRMTQDANPPPPDGISTTVTYITWREEHLPNLDLTANLSNIGSHFTEFGC